MSLIYPVTLSGIILEQPFGEFFVTSIPARILLETAYSDRLKATAKGDGTYKLEGSQRLLADSRLNEIGRFIDLPSAVFPNTIILAANYWEETGLTEKNEQTEEEAEETEQKKWRLTCSLDGATGQLTIPTSEKLAVIIDGQHRLFGFRFARNTERLDFPLLCAVYFGLPKPYQAFLFATVNANQKPVSKSQTYELFGYNVEDESADKWTPEKLAVFLTRKLNLEQDSLLYGHILVPAENTFSQSPGERREQKIWTVSVATIVEGIVKLISTSPKIDDYIMHGKGDYEPGGRSLLKTQDGDKEALPPPRELYIEINDQLIYTGIKNYFEAVSKVFWKHATSMSLICKTVGLQALFDIAKHLFFSAVKDRDFSPARFERLLQPASEINFSDSFFQTSGTGRGRIRTAIELCLGLRAWDSIKSKALKDYIRILPKQGQTEDFRRKLLFLKELGVKDPNIDLFLAVTSDKESEETVKNVDEALAAGADVDMTSNELLEKYQNELSTYPK